MSQYPGPGRGAWSLTGGLLPVSAGSRSKAGYYRRPQPGEAAVGSAYASGKDDGHHAYVVNLGVRAIQTLTGLEGADVDGWFGEQTSARVVAAQKRWGLDADAVVGRVTMRAALSDLVAEIAGQNHVPTAILGGLVLNESSLDPAAVGVNGEDHGIAQINLGAHGDKVSLEQAMDPDFSLMWSAMELSMTYRTWVGHTQADPWDIAIANHNSPALARRWAQAGAAPFVVGRAFQIEDYVAKVRTLW
jgi:hypothetical protein